jgi:hypothetical protein
MKKQNLELPKIPKVPQKAKVQKSESSNAESTGVHPLFEALLTIVRPIGNEEKAMPEAVRRQTTTTK